MRKNLTFGLGLALIIFAASCSKNNTNNPAATNSWKYYTETYQVISSARSGNTVTFTTPNSSAYQVTLALKFFNAIPATAGSYTVVNGTPTAANQISITASPGSVSFYSTGLHHEAVAVTVAAGKLTAVIPSIQVANSPFYSDSVYISGTVTEP